MTASSFREEEARARKICDGFIRKPFNRAEFIAELKRFLKSAQPAGPASAPQAHETARPSLPAAPVSPEALARRPELLAKLQQEQTTVWPRLCKTKGMGEIGQFAGRLRNWADQGQWSALRTYADLLQRQVQDFDLERLPKSLLEYPAVIASLS